MPPSRRPYSVGQRGEEMPQGTAVGDETSSLIPATYKAWNAALGSFFFNRNFAARPAYLQVDSDTLPRVAPGAGVDPHEAEASFIQAVRSQLTPGGRNPFADLLRGIDDWRTQIRDHPATPPFLGLLGICVLAASKMCADPARRVRSSNYYVQLNELLGLRPQGMPGHFGRVTDLWEQLNWWLDEVNGGALGLATARTHRFFINVGYPISQCLLREVDRHKLPDFFRWEGLAPGEVVDGEELIPRLSMWATRTTCTLSRRGRSVFRNGDVALIRQAADVVAAELALWDGGSTDTEGRRYATIELRVEVRRAGRNLVCELYPRAPEGFPEGKYQGGPQPLDLTRLPGMPWFEPLPSAMLEDALANGVVLQAGGYVLQYRQCGVIPLGEHAELGGWVSCGRVCLGESHLVLCDVRHRAEVEDLLERCAEPGWMEAPRPEGLPSAWVCLRNVRIVTPPKKWRETLDCLAPRLRVGIQLVGGLKLERDVWLKGGEPDAIVTTPQDQPVAVRIDGQAVKTLGSGTGIVRLKELGLGQGEHEVVAGSERRRFHLCVPGYCPTRHARTERLGYVLRRDLGSYAATYLGATGVREGGLAKNDEVCVLGAMIVGLPQDITALRRQVVVLPLGYKRYILLGSGPGEIAEYRFDSKLPYWFAKKSGHLQGEVEVRVGFEPQWLIKVGRKGRKHLCPIGKPALPETDVAESNTVQDWIRWARKRYRYYHGPLACLDVWEEYRRIALALAEER